MNWNLEGMTIEATYLGGMFPVSGKVELSRVKYGGGITHHVVLDEPISVFGSIRDRVIVEHREVTKVRS